MPHYLAIGVTWERFMDSCPKELEPFEKAHRSKIYEFDALMYEWWGNYGISAVSVAVEHCLAGRKAKLEYLKEPIMLKALENYGLTEQQIYEKELKKALFSEEQWIKISKKKGLPETII